MKIYVAAWRTSQLKCDVVTCVQCRVNSATIFYVLLSAHPCINMLISPTRCAILLNIFISLLYMFRASMCPSSGENHCICATLLCVTLGGVWSGDWIDPIQPADQTPSIQNDNCHWRIDTVILSWWWAHGCAKHVEKKNKYIKQNCAPY